jgi:hypothetical protein
MFVITPSSNHHISVKVNFLQTKGAIIRIGELAKQTTTSRRQLRYYEEQGLISADREANGYRQYGDALIERVGLLTPTENGAISAN